jgi:hypothetical protein
MLIMLVPAKDVTKSCRILEIASCSSFSTYSNGALRVSLLFPYTTPSGGHPSWTTMLKEISLDMKSIYGIACRFGWETLLSLSRWLLRIKWTQSSTSSTLSFFICYHRLSVRGPDHAVQDAPAFQIGAVGLEPSVQRGLRRPRDRVPQRSRQPSELVGGPDSTHRQPGVDQLLVDVLELGLQGTNAVHDRQRLIMLL